MGRLIERRTLDVHVITGKFCGFNNSSFNVVYIDHTSNGRKSTTDKWIPCDIQIKGPYMINLVKQMVANKEIKVGTKIEIAVERSTGPTGIIAILLSINVIT